MGKGWNIYNLVLTPGNLGGTVADDILARDKSGVLWLYKGTATARVTTRVKAGSGWNIYTHITGKGDLSGDGRADILAKDASGVLWLYKGTGNAAAPFSARTKVGSGWNIYNKIIANGDLNLDGRADVVARDAAGALWLYKGTGNAAAPFSSPRQGRLRLQHLPQAVLIRQPIGAEPTRKGRTPVTGDAALCCRTPCAVLTCGSGCAARTA